MSHTDSPHLVTWIGHFSDRYRPPAPRLRVAAGLAALLLAGVPRPLQADQHERQARPQSAALAQRSSEEQAAGHPLARWIDLQTLNLSTRYRLIEDAAGRTLNNQLQTQEVLRARFKADAGGRYGFTVGVATGSSMTSGWNSTGIGTGDGTAKVYVKQLFAGAEPVKGLELQYGSLYPLRGEATEVTHFDNDAYLSGGRATVRHPSALFLDELSVTVGHLGDFETPSVFDRLDSLTRSNFWQVLGVRRFGSALSVSTDYRSEEEDGTLRQAARWKVGLMPIDTLRVEYGVVLTGRDHDAALAVAAAKTIRTVSVELGYATIEGRTARVNGDRYPDGGRLFSLGSIPLPADLSLSWFVQKQIDGSNTTRNDIRLDIVLTWNALKSIKGK